MSIRSEKSLISNTDFSNLENDYLEICLHKMLISNLISKNPWGFPGPPGVCMGLCVFVCGMCGGWSVVKSWGVDWGHAIGSLKTGFRD